MKSPYVASALLFVGLLLGLAIGAGWLDQRANAQAGGADAPRFQVSAWAGGLQNHARDGRVEYGCYIINNETGELWATTGGNKPNKIGEKLK